MFIDLSGFTAMTESMMARGTEGAEKLTQVLNDIFGPMVSLVYRRGGIIPYFAGDAFTAIFPDNGKEGELRATEFMATARDIRELFSSKDFQFDDFEIGVKIGLSYGTVEWGIVGGESKSFYFRGPAINACAESQMRANQQEIVLDLALCEQLPAHFPISPTPHPDYYFLSEGLRYTVEDRHREDRDLDMQPEVARLFLPDPVIEYNDEGEFRNVISVFISFSGVGNHEALNRFVTVVLREMNNFSGYFKEVDFGDKGGVLFGFFGAPVSYENNLERALEFITAVREHLEEYQRTSNLVFRTGMTRGLAYTGIVGGPERCQYAAVGNRVNIAARLMSYADWGECLVDAEIAKSRHFKFKHKGDIRYKGVAGAVPTYILEGRSVDTQMEYNGPIIGRDAELEDLNDRIVRALTTEQPGLSYVYGEAGIGKSRLTFELRNRVRSNTRAVWYICQADQILRKPFNPFIYFLKYYFRQSHNLTRDENQAAFEQRYQWLINDSYRSKGEEADELQRELVRVESVFAALVGLDTAGTLWSRLDARGRYENTFSALATLFLAESRMHPVVLELEDAHWYDDNSREFLRKFITRIDDQPIYLLVTSRYTDNGRKPRLLPDQSLRDAGIDIHEVDLGILQSEGQRSFAEHRLGGPISDEFFEMLERSSNGNPFYLEQIIEYFVESNLLEQDEEKVWNIREGSIKLTGSINSILTARIDRLSNLVKETVKAAAVIGREFEVPVLHEVMARQEIFDKSSGDAQQTLRRQIRSAERGQIWQAVNELRYIFKHSLLRETVYDMQLRARLRELHANIGEAIEKLYSNNLPEHYQELAFHYEQAENSEKSELYFSLAADYSRDNFQNADAILYYDKLVKLLKEQRPYSEKQVKVLLKLGTMQQLIGNWDEAEESLQDGLSQAHRINNRHQIARANYLLGRLRLLKGDYTDAQIYLETSISTFQYASSQEGIEEVYGEMGTLKFRQGEYDAAQTYLQRAIQLGRKSERGRIAPQYVATLGLSYMNRGEYATGIRYIQRELEVCRAVEDKQGQATLLINMGIVYFESGDIEKAGQCYEEGLRMSEDLGNKLLITIAKGSLGRVRQATGNYQQAMQLFIEDLRLAEELGDKQGISIALGLIGDLHTEQGNFTEAASYMERNLELSRELGYRKGIAKAINSLGDVYYNQKKYERAIEYYDMAIEGSRSIDNKLVLASSLIEKAQALMASERNDEALDALREGHFIAGEIGHEGLLFSQKLLRARIYAQNGESDRAEELLGNIKTEDLDREQIAELNFLHYELKKDEAYRNTALSIYRDLFATTPKFIYQQRIDELN